jgi:hypothetical protein
MNNNSIVLKSFIKHLEEWFKYITTTYKPKDTRFVKCKVFFEGIKMANPKLLIMVWKNNITVPYKEQIYTGDIEFFLNKDYTEDLSDDYKTETVDTAISDLRFTIRTMEVEHIIESVKYMQNLCKLSELYN